jgi:thioredoxin reductase
MGFSRLNHDSHGFIYGTGITKPVYMIHRRTTIDAGAIVCSSVRDNEPKVRKTMDIVRTMKNMKTK